MPDALISYPFTGEGLLSALEALGTTPNAVAQNLFAMGIRGKRGNDCGCPLAVYFRTVIEGASSASVLLDVEDKVPYVRVYSGPESFVDAEGTLATASFIRLFDRAGRYTDLEVSDAA